jgi:hypothetical protein
VYDVAANEQSPRDALQDFAAGLVGGGADILTALGVSAVGTPAAGGAYVVMAGGCAAMRDCNCDASDDKDFCGVGDWIGRKLDSNPNNRAGNSEFRFLPLNSDVPEEQFYIDAVNMCADQLAPIAFLLGYPEWFEISEVDWPRSVTIQIGIIDAISNGSSSAWRIDESERIAIQAMPKPGALSAEVVDRTISRWNRTVAMAEEGAYGPEAVSDSYSILEYAGMIDIAGRANAAREATLNMGFNGLFQPLALASTSWVDRLQKGSGVCATVTLELEQRVAITRSAFRASLGLENPGGSGSIDSIGVSLIIRDQEGSDATGLFLIEPPTLEGLTDINGGGSLPEGASGKATWRIIPSDLAAPLQDTPYFVSGEFRYSVNGSAITVPLVPSLIMVQPNASLDLQYFIERDVFGDDPFTSDLEPSLPFNLGLLMQNRGAGVARNVRIAAAEPKITDNDRGLVIDFDLIGTQVGGQAASPSLNITLGDIVPGGSQVARWLFLSSLQGEFTSFDAEFVSLNGFNTPEFSLIDSIDIFELDHIVRAGAYGGTGAQPDDGLFDFLTNEIPDLADLPDRLRQSTGAIDSVTARSGITATVARDMVTAFVDVPMGVGWTYARITDPFDGAFPLQEVERSDGKVLLPNLNAWQTNKIERNGPDAGTPKRFVHLFDRGGTGSYTLRFSGDATPPTVVEWQSVANHGPVGLVPIVLAPDGSTSEPRSTGISTIRVEFSEMINADTFQPINIVARGRVPGGAVVDLAGITVSTELESSGTAGLIRFVPSLPDAARYCLELNNVKDVAGNVATEGIRRVVTALQGDLDANLVVNGADVDLCRTLRTQAAGGLIDTTVVAQVRTDIVADGRINASDQAVVRAVGGKDATGIPDACDLPNALPPAGDDDAIVFDGESVNPIDEFVEADFGDDGSSPEKDSDPGEDSKFWRPIETAFAMEGEVIRVDPSRFAIGTPLAGADVPAILAAHGIGLDRVHPLGFEDWLIIEAADSGAVRDALAAGLVYTAPLLRDDAGEYLVSQETLLVAFDPVTPEAWRRQVLEAEFGANVQVAPIESGGVQVVRVDAYAMTGEEVVAAANRLAARQDIAMVEPNFVMFGRGGAPTVAGSVCTDCLVPAVSSLPATAFLAESASIVMLDDGAANGGVAKRATTFGAGTIALPETAADVFGSRGVGAIVDTFDSVRDASPQAPGSIGAIRAWATLDAAGRAVTTVESQLKALDTASTWAPTVVASPVETAYSSVMVESGWTQLLDLGCVIVCPDVPGMVPATRTDGLMVRIPVLEAGSDPTGSPSLSRLSAGETVARVAAMIVVAHSVLPPAADAADLVAAASELAARMNPVGSAPVTGSPADAISQLVESATDLSVDFDGDGVITQRDLLKYVEGFGTEEPGVDTTGDGEVDIQDVQEVLRRFVAAVSR